MTPAAAAPGARPQRTGAPRRAGGRGAGRADGGPGRAGPAPAGNSASPSGATLAEQVYRRLLASIQAHAYEGREVLSEAALARQFGVSRTPVREALKWLNARGLVDIVPRRGTFISLPDVARVHEIFDVRQALEGMAARLAAAAHDRAELAGLRARLLAAWRGQRPREVYEIGREFHDWVVRSAGNRGLAEHLATVRSQASALSDVAAGLEGRMERSVEEYGAIMDALARGDADGAEAAMRRHIASVRDQLLGRAPARADR